MHERQPALLGVSKRERPCGTNHAAAFHDGASKQALRKRREHLHSDRTRPSGLARDGHLLRISAKDGDIGLYPAKILVANSCGRPQTTDSTYLQLGGRHLKSMV